MPRCSYLLYFVQKQIHKRVAHDLGHFDGQPLETAAALLKYLQTVAFLRDQNCQFPARKLLGKVTLSFSIKVCTRLPSLFPWSAFNLNQMQYLDLDISLLIDNEGSYKYQQPIAASAQLPGYHPGTHILWLH